MASLQDVKKSRFSRERLGSGGSTVTYEGAAGCDRVRVTKFSFDLHVDPPAFWVETPLLLQGLKHRGSERGAQSLGSLEQHALLWLVKRNQVRCFSEVWSPSTSYCAVNSAVKLSKKP